MEQVEEAVIRYLIEEMGVKFHPLHIPQNINLPHIAYRITSTDELQHLDGAAERAFSRIRFDVHANVYSEAANLAEQLRLNLQGFVLNLSDNDMGILLDSESDTYFPPQNGSNVGVYAITLIFTFLHQQEI